MLRLNPTDFSHKKRKKNKLAKLINLGNCLIKILCVLLWDFPVSFLCISTTPSDVTLSFMEVTFST